MTIYWKAVISTLLWCSLFSNITQFVILENLSVLDLALSGVKGLKVQIYQFWTKVNCTVYAINSAADTLH